jgi:hypothetical protein
LSDILAFIKVGSCRRVVLATPRYFQELGKPVKPQDLSQHETVIYAQRAGGTTWTFRKHASEVGVTVRGRVRVSAALYIPDRSANWHPPIVPPAGIRRQGSSASAHLHSNKE